MCEIKSAALLSLFLSSPVFASRGIACQPKKAAAPPRRQGKRKDIKNDLLYGLSWHYPGGFHTKHLEWLILALILLYGYLYRRSVYAKSRKIPYK